MRELAASPDGDQYVTVLRELFDPDSPTHGSARPLGEPAVDLGRAVTVRPADEGSAS
jgi:hypothetical protein